MRLEVWVPQGKQGRVSVARDSPCEMGFGAVQNVDQSDEHRQHKSHGDHEPARCSPATMSPVPCDNSGRLRRGGSVIESLCRHEKDRLHIPRAVYARSLSSPAPCTIDVEMTVGFSVQACWGRCHPAFLALSTILRFTALPPLAGPVNPPVPGAWPTMPRWIGTVCS
jgi:hypothetical protein